MKAAERSRERLPQRAPGGWTWGGWPPAIIGEVIAASVWRRGPLTVISALEWAEYPDGIGEGPQWHLSITRAGGRPGESDVRRVLRAFGVATLVYDEDNHHPGNARHFWIPVDPAHRVACQCKTDETLVVERDGYRWSNPKDGPCAGCELAPAIGKVCPLHPREMPISAGAVAKRGGG